MHGMIMVVYLLTALFLGGFGNYLIPPSDLPEGALRDAAIEQLVGQAALDMEVQALDIGVSDQGIGDAIRNDPSFQQNGKFDADRFRRSLSSIGPPTSTRPCSRLSIIFVDLRVALSARGFTGCFALVTGTVNCL